MSNLKAIKRESTSSSSINKLRATGFIPAILYGGKNPNSGTLKMERQALHARYLELNHPLSGTLLSFSANLPFDMESFLQSQK